MDKLYFSHLFSTCSSDEECPRMEKEKVLKVAKDTYEKSKIYTERLPIIIKRLDRISKIEKKIKFKRYDFDLPPK